MAAKVTELLGQPNKWTVEIKFDNGKDPLTVICVNRPAITFGESMTRIADAEQEVWISSKDVDEINVTMNSKRTLLQLVEQFEPERLRAYAQKFRSSNSAEEEEFVISQMLSTVADMYDDVAEFVGAGVNDG